MKLRTVLLLTAGMMAGFSWAAPGVRAEEALELNLRDCFQRAMNDNLGLREARLGLRYDGLSVENARTSFDPTLSFTVNRDESKSPSYTSYIPVDTIEREQTSANLTLGKKISTGGNWGFGAYNTLSESNVEREKNYTSYFGFSFEQPLLRGRGKKIAHSTIYMARLAEDASIHTVENEAIDLLVQVEKAYWNLVYSRETLAVREMAMAQAESLLVYNEKGRELGVLIESDVLEAKSAFLLRQQEVLEQRNAIRVAEDELKLLLNIEAKGQDDLRLIPTDMPSEPAVVPDMESALESALRDRPDYLLAESEIEQRKIRLGVARNAVLPSLDFNTSYQLNGSGETYDKNLRRVGEVDAYGWTVGLNLSYPIHNRGARVELERRDIELKRAQVNLESLRHRIETDIRSGARKVGTNRERIEVAKMGVEANEMKLRKEEEKFRNHLSTSYLVLQYQTDLANARNSYNQAMVEYMLSILDLRKASGSLLRDLNIDIVRVEP